MDEKQLQALANELAKNLKTPDDLSQFDRLLTPATAIPQRPLPLAMALWNSALHAIVMALSNRNW